MDILNHSAALLGGSCDDASSISNLGDDPRIPCDSQDSEEVWSVALEPEKYPKQGNHGLQIIDQFLKVESFLGMTLFSPKHHLHMGSIESADGAAGFVSQSNSFVDDDSLCWEPIPIGPAGSMNVVKQIDLAMGDSFRASSLSDSFYAGMSHIFTQPRRSLKDPGDAFKLIPPPSAPEKSQPLIRETSVSSTLSSLTTKERSGSDRWNDRYVDLKEFVKSNGHCHVPIKYKENELLSRWTKRQRYQWKLKQEGKQSSMTDARQALLEDLGFVWDVRTMIWETRYKELVRFHKKHGHCNVNINCKEFPKLGTWVKCQRRQHCLMQNCFKSHMTPSRAVQLDALSFCWNGKHNGK